MKQKYWQKIESILDKALALQDPQKKDEYLIDACDDDQLYREVILLMQSIQKAEEEGFLEIRDE